MNARPATANPYQLADPRRYVEMQAALSSSEFFRKKADEWDKEHGFIVKPLNFRSAIEEWRSLLRHDLQYRFAKESGGACA